MLDTTGVSQVQKTTMNVFILVFEPAVNNTAATNSNSPLACCSNPEAKHCEFLFHAKDSEFSEQASIKNCHFLKKCFL